MCLRCVEAWYPGQEDGNAVADILFGLRNPSGKLPMTFGNSAREAAYATDAQFPGVLVDPPHWLTRRRFSAQYTEGLQMGYRWYEANNVTPVFPFGFGLSYTTFAYSGLSVTSNCRSTDGPHRVERHLHDHQHGQQARGRGLAGLCRTARTRRMSRPSGWSVSRRWI